MGFTIHFYIIFGTNLLTQGPVQIAIFFLFQCFAEKEYQTESKWNETFGRVIFGTNVIQRTWSRSQETTKAVKRVPGAPPKAGRAPHPRGPLVPLLTDILRRYILIYPENIQEHHETLFTLPQPSVPKRSQLGAFFGAPPEGESIT